MNLHTMVEQSQFQLYLRQSHSQTEATRVQELTLTLEYQLWEKIKILEFEIQENVAILGMHPGFFASSNANPLRTQL